jgi:hypothetical protein
MIKALPFVLLLTAIMFVPSNGAAESFQCAARSCQSTGSANCFPSYYSVEAESKEPPGAIATGCTFRVQDSQGAVILLPLVRWEMSGTFRTVLSKCADCLVTRKPDGKYESSSPLGIYLSNEGHRSVDCVDLHGVTRMEVSYGERDSDCR